MADQTIPGTLSVTEKVGIRIEDPSAQLHIASPAGDPSEALIESSGVSLKLAVDATGASIGTTNAFPLSIQTGGSAQIVITPAGNVTVAGPLTVQSALTATGNVSIGTDTTPATLEVKGNIQGKDATLTGPLTVGGNLVVSGTVDGRDVSADGEKLDSHIGIISGNPHGTTADQVGALPLAGGTISGNLVVTGTVDERDVSADGQKLDSHIGITSGNPHGTTAAQVKALALAGGTLTGNLRVNGNLGVNVAPATRFHVAGASPAVRIADGTQAAGRVLVSDATGNAIWKQNSRYFVSGSLNVEVVFVSTTPVKMGDFVVFSKASAESTIEVTLNSLVSTGAGPDTGVTFQIRIDDNKTTMANEAAVTSNAAARGGESISIFAVFQGLAAGNHTVSVWVVASLLTVSNVKLDLGAVLDPVRPGGRIVVKETF